MPITADVAYIRYYQNDAIVAEYEVKDKTISLKSGKAPKNQKGDTIKLLDKDEYDISCLVVE